MGPLLEIRSIPFQYELQVIDAKLEMQAKAAAADVSRQRGGFQMRHNPARIHIDSSDARASMGLVGVGTAVKQSAERGLQGALNATGQFAKEGNMLMDSRNQNAVTSIAYQRTQNSIDTMIGFLPSTPAKVSFDPHNLSMQYEMDKMTFDWRTNNRPEMKFTPASIDFKVKEYARLEIEYIGGPVYVPKSADPNYVIPPGLDVRG